MQKRTQWMVAALLVAGIGRGSHLFAQDADRDGFPDAVDNCPAVFNLQQLDTGGLGDEGPNGTGNRCECADSSDNGIVDLLDIVVPAAVLPSLAAFPDWWRASGPGAAPPC